MRSLHGICKRRGMHEAVEVQRQQRHRRVEDAAKVFVLLQHRADEARCGGIKAVYVPVGRQRTGAAECGPCVCGDLVGVHLPMT